MWRKNAPVLWGGALLVFLLALNLSSAMARVPMVAFLSDRSGDDEVYILFDDGKVTKLTENNSRTVDLDWAPDGRTVIFASNLEGGELFDIVSIDVETEDETNLTQGNFGSNMQNPGGRPKAIRASLLSPPLCRARSSIIGMLAC